MGVMERFRSSTHIILWVLIGSFGLLWVLSDVNFFDAINRGPRSLGAVNGKSISFEEYNGRIQYYSDAYTQQTGNSMTPEIRAVYEKQAWDELVSSKLLEQKMDELGITVTDNELLDMVYGENPDPLIRQYFQREDGTVDRVAIQNVLSSDQYSREAQAIELQLRQKRRQEKLSNFITAGLQITDTEIEDAFKKDNTFAKISYIRFPYNEVADSELTISDKELRKYYTDHKEKYTQKESYRAKFVTFSKLPTKEDTAQIIKDLTALRDRFAAADDDSLFLVQQQSITPFNNTFVAKSDVKEEYKPVLDVKKGEVTDVIITGSTANIIKKVDETRNEIKFAVMTYLIEALPATIDAAAEKADEFEYFATEESDFDKEAERRGLTVKEAFATEGSSFISGLGSSQQVMNFFSKADVGEVSKALELDSDFAVLKLTEKVKAGYRPFEEVKSQIESQLKIEKRKSVTLDKLNTLLASNTSLESLSEASGNPIKNDVNVNATATVLSGAGREPEVIGAIFSMEAGTTSGALEGTSAAYVVKIEEKTEADISLLNDTQKNQIRNRLEQEINQKFLAVWIDRLKEEADIDDNRNVLLR